MIIYLQLILKKKEQYIYNKIHFFVIGNGTTKLSLQSIYFVN